MKGKYGVHVKDFTDASVAEIRKAMGVPESAHAFYSNPTWNIKDQSAGEMDRFSHSDTVIKFVRPAGSVSSVPGLRIVKISRERSPE